MVVVVVVVRIPLLKREVVTLLYYFRPVCSTFRYSGWLSRAAKGCQGSRAVHIDCAYQVLVWVRVCTLYTNSANFTNYVRRDFGACANKITRRI